MFIQIYKPGHGPAFFTPALEKFNIARLQKSVALGKDAIMNQTVLILVISAAAAVIIFLFIRNQKDKKKIVDQMKNDYRQRKPGDEDIDVEQRM